MTLGEKLAAAIPLPKCDEYALVPVEGVLASYEEAYVVQRDVASRLGGQVVGWKIGASGEGAQAALGVPAPFCAPLLAPLVHTTNNATIVAARAPQKPLLEVEFAVVLASAVDETTSDVRAAIGCIRPAFEVACRRTEGDSLAGAGFLLCADLGINAAAVVPSDGGLEDVDAALADGVQLSLTVNGEHVAAGGWRGNMMWADGPVGAVAWLAKQDVVRAAGGLKAGDVVLTGSCTGMKPVVPGDVAVADCGPLGTITARFE